MKKQIRKDKNRINLIISFLIITGFVMSMMVNYLSYSKVIKEDIKNISRLSSTNIYSEINNELVKPIFVSLTMANDSFLKEWLKNEDYNKFDSLQRYLKGMEKKYDYSSVFMVSESSKVYYHFNKINKILSKGAPHDEWYFEFLESGRSYDLDVDIDEVSNQVTVFVNCRIEDENGKLLGVVGVGLEMKEVQEILATFQDAYALEAFLIDKNGLVQVHTDDSLIEEYNVNNDLTINKYMKDIVSNKATLETYVYKENDLDGYLITRYVDELEWYLMVKKDTLALKRSFNNQILGELMIVLFVLLGVVLISNQLIKKHHINLDEIAKTDQLTKLLNRRGFDYLIFDKLKEAMEQDDYLTVFIFDIDDFKKINDTQGHLFGDRVIERISKLGKDIIGTKGVVARWGGDEFAGYLIGDYEESKEVLINMIKSISTELKYSEFNLSISIGVTKSRSIDTPDSILGRADNALYIAKENGKNRLHEVN